MKIHENIRKARKAAGITQQELADALGVRQKDVSRWETGAYIPGIKNVAAICRILNVSADILLETGLKDHDI